MDAISANWLRHSAIAIGLAISVSIVAAKDTNTHRQKLTYIPAEDFARTAAEVLAHRSGSKMISPDPGNSVLVGGVKITADTQANEVVVEGSAADLDIVKGLASELNRRPQQVYLSAVIAEVQLDRKTTSALDYVQALEGFEVDGRIHRLAELQRPGASGTILTAPPAQTDTDKRGVLFVPSEHDEFLNNLIGALEKRKRFKEQQFRVIARPFVFTGSDQPASIQSGGFTTEQATGDGDGGSVVTPEPMSFEVTPRIVADQSVSLRFGVKTTAIDASGSVRLANREILLLPLGITSDRKGHRHEQLLMIQPRIVGDRKLADTNAQIPRATPLHRPDPDSQDRPALAGSGIQCSDFKHSSVAEFVPLASDALARATGAEVEYRRGARLEKSGSVVAGQTLLVADLLASKLLALGPVKDLQILEKMHHDIDVPRHPVLVRAIIADVTLGENLKFGLDVLGPVQGNHFVASFVSIYSPRSGGWVLSGKSLTPPMFNFKS